MSSIVYFSFAEVKPSAGLPISRMYNPAVRLEIEETRQDSPPLSNLRLSGETFAKAQLVRLAIARETWVKPTAMSMDRRKGLSRRLVLHFFP